MTKTKKIILISVTLIIALSVFSLLPGEAASTNIKNIRISSGVGINEIASVLKENGLINSTFLFKVVAFFSGNAHKLRPGKYELQGNLSYGDLIKTLVKGGDEEEIVKIPEGSNIFDIDALLSEKGIIKPGELVSYNKSQATSYEGYLFPDTYYFLQNSTPKEIVNKMTSVFEEKTSSLWYGLDQKSQYKTLILASLLEKEVPEFKDQQLVAGILLKRLRNNWLLQVDSSICYAKEPMACYPLSPLDFKIDSQYNTYMYKGLPITPIGNPGVQAIKAALSPIDSKYWYYISRPSNKETIFSSTLDEQSINRARYLR